MFDDRSPIYRQIAEQIRRDVITGALADDDQVMSTNQYATYHRINPATAAKAFQALVDEGLLYKRRGVGMFVAPGAAARLRAEHRAGFVERVVRPLVDEARYLGLALDEIVDAVRAEFDRTGPPATSPPTTSAPRSTR
jgi:GntR family transcriptional regulator